MKVDNNKLYDLLRKYAEEYSLAHTSYITYDKLVSIRFNEKTYAQLEVLQEDDRLTFDKYADILSRCELQKGEKEEIQEIIDNDDEETILNTFKMYLEDIGFEKEVY